MTPRGVVSVANAIICGGIPLRTSVLAAILTLLCATTSICAAANLVANGSFEEATTGWYRSHASGPTAVGVVERTDGGPCLQLSSDGETVDLGCAVAIERGKRYVFQADFRRSAAGEGIAAMLIVRRATGQDAYYNIGTASTTLLQWQHFARVVSPPGDAESARILLMNRLKDAQAWFDDVQLVEVTDSSGPAADYCPKLAIPRLPAAPTIDGRIEDEQWRGAAAITGMVRIADGTPAEANTTWLIGHDGVNLLIAARCEEPHMDAVSPTAVGHDTGPFGDEVVELFIDADNNHATYYHLAISVGGADYDSSSGEGAVDGTAWESGWTAKAHRGGDHWSIEASIPFASMALAGSGDIWGLNVCRERHTPGHSENTAWSATGSRFHSPRRFGDMVGLADVAQTPVTASIAGVDDLTPGRSKLAVLVQATERFTGRMAVRATLLSPTGRVIDLERALTARPEQEQRLELPFRINERGKWQASVTCTDAATGTLLCASAPTSFVVPPLLRARVAVPWYRGRIFSKMNLSEVEIECEVALREFAPGMRLVVVPSQDTPGRLAGQAAVTDRVITVKLPCADLPEGRYELEVGLLDQKSEMLARVKGLSIQKLPPAETEIWFGRDNNMLINGTPHFPTGFYSLDSRGMMQSAAEGGYTLFHTYASSRYTRLDPATTDWDWQAYFDTGAAAGMRCFSGFGIRGDDTEDFWPKLLAGEKPEAERIMTTFIERYRSHPGLGAWYVYDEPELHGRTVEEMAWAYGLVDRLDPYHPKVVCQVGWTDDRYVDSLDVLMPDPYPIRATNSRPLRSVARAVHEARRTVSDEKPVWPVLQWYAYEGGRFPAPTEMRCMAFLAVAAGAKGLTWYSFYHGYKNDAAHWPDLQAIGRELRGIEDIVLAPEADIRLATDPAEPPVEMLLKQSPNGLHLVLVNYSDQPLQGLRLTFPVDVTSARDRLSGETYPLTGNTLHVDLAAYQPMVLDVAVER